MDNKEKARIISPGVDPDERVTVDFDDERDLNAEVTRCTAELVDLALETRFPLLRQNISVPLGTLRCRRTTADTPKIRTSRFSPAACG